MSQGKEELEELNEVGELRKILEEYPVSDHLILNILEYDYLYITAIRDS